MAAQANEAVPAAIRSGIARVIEAFDEIVRSDGGNVSFVAIEGAKLRAKGAGGAVG